MSEEKVQTKFITWVKGVHPSLIVSSDGSGVFLPAGLAKRVRNMQTHKSRPDVWASVAMGGWFGLYLEFKETARTYKRIDGTLRDSNRLRPQIAMLQLLRSFGYYADIVGGLNEAREIFKWYMSLKPTVIPPNLPIWAKSVVPIEEDIF